MCILRTTSGMVSSASSGGRITMSTPSPSTFSSESVTSAATSMSASSASESPVISQSIHTMRSFIRLSLGPVRENPSGPYGSGTHPEVRAGPARAGAALSQMPPSGRSRWPGSAARPWR
ncbi:hypothetical protein M2168_004303 [Streptomyces sp. CZ24]|nr:hypothetical protein [Streptomyces sp. CZ24]